MTDIICFESIGKMLHRKRKVGKVGKKPSKDVME